LGRNATENKNIRPLPPGGNSTAVICQIKSECTNTAFTGNMEKNILSHHILTEQNWITLTVNKIEYEEEHMYLAKTETGCLLRPQIT